MRRIVGPAVLLALTACGGCDHVPGSAVTNCQAVGIATAKTDILFVVDDSGSMATKQQILASNFAGFIANLASLPVANDYQVAVTTTSVDRWVDGTTTFAGTFIQPCYTATTTCNPAPDGNLPYPAGALVSVSGGTDVCSRVQSTTGSPRVLVSGSSTLVADFTQNSYVGVCGSGKEQGLRAAWNAVSDPLVSGANAGFLRPGARLVLVIISDDDDCSDPLDQGYGNEPCGGTYYPACLAGPPPQVTCTTYDVQNYVNLFTGPIAGEQRDVLVAGIIAVGPGSTPGSWVPSRCAVQDPATCQPGCTANGGGCTSGSQCCSTYCTGSPMTCQPAPSCLADGASCTAASQCCSNYCTGSPLTCQANVLAEHAAPRYKQFVDAFGASGVVDSVCNCTFDATLSRVATLIGQEVPLAQEPADWRLLSVAVTKPGGSTVSCTVGLAGAGGTPDVLYSPATATRPATLTFGGAGVSGTCALQAGDRIDLKIVCAG